MSKLTAYFQGVAIGIVILIGIFGSHFMPAFAAVSTYSVSEFAQHCAANPGTCVKQNFSDVRTGDVTCPNNLTPIKIYVHAGDGQTVYELPHTGFEYSVNGSTVTVNLTTHTHDISWIGLDCGGQTSPSASPSDNPSPSPSPSPSDCGCKKSPTPSPSPSSSAEVSPSVSPSATPSPSPSPSPSENPSPSPSPSAAATPTPTPSSSNPPSSDSGAIGGANTEESGEVLGTYAATGVATDAEYARFPWRTYDLSRHRALWQKEKLPSLRNLLFGHI